jgi:hypothetical protein
VIAGGALQWNNAVADVSGVRAGSILVRSLGSDVSVSGSLIAQAGGIFEYQPGHVSVIASGDLHFTGLLDVSADVQPPAMPTASLSAGGLLTLHPGSLDRRRLPRWRVCGCRGPDLSVRLPHHDREHRFGAYMRDQLDGRRVRETCQRATSSR